MSNAKFEIRELRWEWVDLVTGETVRDTRYGVYANDQQVKVLATRCSAEDFVSRAESRWESRYE